MTAPSDTVSTSSAPAPEVVQPAAGVFVEARDDDTGWRPVSRDTKRDLDPWTQERMQKLAHHAWEQHRIANRLIELPIAFMLGDGVEIQVNDEEAQAWLNRWWNDPITSMPLNLEKRMRELSLFGEQVVVVFRAADGHVRHGAIDVARIKKVITDPDNAALVIGVTVADSEGNERTYKVILDGDDGELLAAPAQAERQKMTAGEIRFWKINDLLTGSRGRSDLLSAIDIADAYTQMLFGEVERASALRMAIWDVTLKGATPQEVEDRARKIRPPEPLSVRVHNDSEVWTTVSPKLESADASETLRVVRNEVLGGATVPEHWYGGGGDVNRATAGEMDEPTYKVFRRRQLFWKLILEAEARHVIRSRLGTSSQYAAGELPPEYVPRAIFPQMQSIDVSRYAQALAQVVAAVASAVSNKLMTRETAIGLIAALADKLGVEIDPDEELKKAMEQAAKETADDVFRVPPDDPPPDPPADPAAPPAQDPAPTP